MPQSKPNRFAMHTTATDTYAIGRGTAHGNRMKVCPLCGNSIAKGEFNQRFERCQHCVHEMYERHRQELMQARRDRRG